jgi:hypothetical protein
MVGKGAPARSVLLAPAHDPESRRRSVENIVRYQSLEG